MTQPAIIDGTTQPGFDPRRTPIIELNGNGLPIVGLFITGGSTTVRGLVINRFGQAGILIREGGGNVLEGNFIGTDATGTLARPNPLGVLLGSGNNRVGGTTAAARNVISGNNGDGIAIDANANGNLVQGNYIGTNAAGTAAVANTQAGIRIFSATNTVGGSATGAGNVISGNANGGVGPAEPGLGQLRRRQLHRHRRDRNRCARQRQLAWRVRQWDPATASAVRRWRSAM